MNNSNGNYGNIAKNAIFPKGKPFGRGFFCFWRKKSRALATLRKSLTPYKRHSERNDKSILSFSFGERKEKLIAMEKNISELREISARLYGVPEDDCRAFFDGGTRQDHSFTQNRQCAYFPCHAGVKASDFNCLFCYCPLYALGERCGGNISYTAKGVKDCSNCAFPHRRENYKAVLARFPEIAKLAARKPGKRS